MAIVCRTASGSEVPFFKEYWDETAGKRDDLEEGIQKLSDGADELTDGLDELDSYGDQFDEASEDIFESYLKQASDGLNGVGLSGELTADNYKQKIDELRAKNDGNGLLKLKGRVKKREFFHASFCLWL